VRRHGWLAFGLALFGFLVVVALRDAPPADPTTNVPERARLASLIEREQSRTQALREQTRQLQDAIDNVQRRTSGTDDVAGRLETARERAGLDGVSGPGLVVTLTDSSFEESPSGNRNDLLIHSGDVHAIVNGLWEAGAQAISVNGERIVATSALLCVGNTLLINGTVHSPPYEFLAIGAPDDLRRDFESDPLVERFADDAEEFGLGFDVEESTDLVVPAFEGSSSLHYAEER